MLLKEDHQTPCFQCRYRAGTASLPPAYPEWPEREMRDDLVPPPPGGPYMSTGLDDFARFPGSGGLRYEAADPEMHSPFFKPDMPWPETPEIGAPRRWLPSGESGT